ncbi:FtsK/SpoIIIE domain-containing protein [Aquihabitans sp. McL0605]|uniref:FtsK/SpoIIIE domain-containing protein n=1 Tax=Aquihabitans sp. McL0605 TaxID=3415671 RepID=UPI003CE9C6FB
MSDRDEGWFVDPSDRPTVQEPTAEERSAPTDPRARRDEGWYVDPEDRATVQEPTAEERSAAADPPGRRDEGWLVDPEEEPPPAPSPPPPPRAEPSDDGGGWDHDFTPIPTRARVWSTSPSQREIVDSVAHIWLRTPKQTTDLVVRWRYLDTTVQELASALARERWLAPEQVDQGLVIDGRHWSPTDELSRGGLVDGSEVNIAGRAVAPERLSSRPAVVQLSGLDAGTVYAATGLRPAPPPTVVDPKINGKAKGKPADTSMADRREEDGADWQDHKLLDSSGWGLRNIPTGPLSVVPGARVHAGALDLRFDLDAPTDRHVLAGVDEGGRARVPFERPPYHPAIPIPVNGKAPVRGTVSTANTTLALLLASAVVPAMTGVAMYAFTKSPLSLVLVFGAVIGPLMSRWANKRATKIMRRNVEADFATALEVFEEWLLTQQAVESAAREHRYPDVPTAVRWMLTYSNRLWHRRSSDPSFLQVLLGYGQAPWAPLVEDVREVEVEQLLEAHSLLPDAPVALDLAAGSIGVCGRRDDTLAVARSLALQVVALHGPADCEVAVIADIELSEWWDWMKWTPHVRRRTGGGLAMTGPEMPRPRSSPDADTPRSTPDAIASYVLASLPPDPPADTDEVRGPTMVVLLDASTTLHANSTGALRTLSSLDRPDLRIIAIAPSRDQLPAVCRSVVTVGRGGDGSARATVEMAGHPTGACRVVGVSGDPSGTNAGDRNLHVRAARAIARFEDPLQARAGGALPDTVRLLRLLGLEGATAKTISDRWEASDTSEHLFMTIGVDESGPVALDLVGHGPHALVGGTTGSGKSELLATLVASMAAAAPPTQVQFLLFDFKGGATFQPFEVLPHVVKVISDLDGSLADRALRLLRAELDYRKRLLAGMADIRDYRRAQKHPGGQHLVDLPRLVVIIDEFGEMKNHVSDYDAQLASVARIGRSLGVHLILSTQTPSEAVKPVISDNARIRLALRLQTGGESIQLLGNRDAADIPSSVPGRTIGRFDDRTVLFQSPFATATALDVHAMAPVDLASFVSGAFGGGEGVFSAVDVSKKPKETHAFVTMAEEACGDRRWQLAPVKGQPNHEAWTDELSATISFLQVREVAARSGSLRTDANPVAVIDDVVQQRHVVSGWSSDVANLLVIGAPDTGKSSALAAAVAGELERATPDDLAVYVIQGRGGPFRDLVPSKDGFVAAVIELDQPERVMRAIDVLYDEMVARNAGASRSHGRILVVIDGYSTMFGLLGSDDRMATRFRGLVEVGRSTNIQFAISCDRVDVCTITGVTNRFPNMWETSRRWVLRTSEMLSLMGTNGLDADGSRAVQQTIRTAPPGRFYSVENGLFGQLAFDGMAEAVRLANAASPRSSDWIVETVDALPEDLRSADLPKATIDDGIVRLPVGIGVASGQVEWVTASPKSVFLVAGATGSARTPTIGALVDVLHRSGVYDEIFAIAPPDGLVLPDSVKTFGLPQAAEAFDVAIKATNSRLLIVDDAQRLATRSELRLSDEVEDAAGTLTILAGVTYDGFSRSSLWWLRDFVSTLGRLGILIRPTRDDLVFMDNVDWNNTSRGDSTRGDRGYLIDSNQSTRLELLVLPTR